MGSNMDALYLCGLRQHYNASANVSEDVIRQLDLYQKRMELDAIFLPLELALCVLSISVSVLNTVILTRKAMLRSSLNCLLVALEVCNIIFGLSLIQRAIILVIFGHRYRTEALLFVEEIAGITKYSSAYVVNWLTVLIASWRFIALTWPFRVGALLNRRRALLTILVLPFFCSLYAISYPLRYEFKSKTFVVCRDLVNNRTEEMVSFYRYMRKWKTDKWVISKRFTLSLSVLYYFLPCACFVLITVGLVWTIYKYRRIRKNLCDGNTGALIEKGQTRTTLILIVMLSFFLVGNSLPLAFNLLEVVSKNIISVKNELLATYFHYFLVSLFTNSFSFFAYYFMGTNFRDTFREVINCGVVKKTPSRKPSTKSVKELTL